MEWLHYVVGALTILGVLVLLGRLFDFVEGFGRKPPPKH